MIDFSGALRERAEWLSRRQRISPSPRCRAPARPSTSAQQTAEAQKAIDAVKPLLKGKTVGVQGSTNHANFADKYLKGTAEIREYKTTEAHDLDLAAGRIDAVLADSDGAFGTLDKPEFKDYVHRRAGPHRRRPRRGRRRRPPQGGPS